MSEFEPDPKPSAEPGLGPPPLVLDRARIRAGIRAALFGDEPGAEEHPQLLGRFRVRGEIGRGATGIVLRAYDPELARDIAIKLLRPQARGAARDDEQDASARLIREAQALAKLSHPNVIAVHEVGRWEGRAFIAMELVDGESLRRWLETRRSRAAVLEMFVQAGRGLAAAHEVGLVHRDFKPENVLLGLDGRVRVVDFGLARAMPPEGTLDATSPFGEGGGGHADATRSGAVMGTPAYMSPEQHAGKPADARSDQFSFCVALWEALTGQRPFAGRTYDELAASVLAGEPRPHAAALPRRVASILRRGLDRDPQRRFSSMDALLDALEREPRVRWLLGVGMLGTVTAIAFARASGATAENDIEHCRRDAALHRVWDDDRRAALERSFERLDAPWSSHVWRSTATLLDRYADTWTTAAREACVSASLSGGEDPVAKRRHDCLAERRSHFEELVHLLATADESIAVHAVEAAATLADVSACADPRRLEAWQRSLDPEASMQLSKTRSKLGVARALGYLAKYDEAIAVAEEVASAARRLGDRATEAAALLVQGHERARKGDAQAEATLRAALERAGAAHALRAEAMIRLIEVVSRDAQRHEEVLALAAEAAAVLEVVGAEPLLRGKLEHNRGVAAQRAGRHDEALAHFEVSLGIYERYLGKEHPEIARIDASIGTTLGIQGQHDAAEAHLRRALARFEAVLGPEHPTVGAALGNLAAALARRERHEEALPLLRRALGIKQQSLPVHHPSVVRGMFNLAVTLHETQHHEEAFEVLSQSYRLRTRDVEGDAELVAWLQLFGRIELTRGRAASARPWLERAIAAGETAKRSEAALAHDRFFLARAIVDDEPARAREMARAVLVLRERELADDPNDDAAREHADEIRAWLRSHRR